MALVILYSSFLSLDNSYMLPHRFFIRFTGFTCFVLLLAYLVVVSTCRRLCHGICMSSWRARQSWKRVPLPWRSPHHCQVPPDNAPQFLAALAWVWRRTLHRGSFLHLKPTKFHSDGKPFHCHLPTSPCRGLNHVFLQLALLFHSSCKNNGVIPLFPIYSRSNRILGFLLSRDGPRVWVSIIAPALRRTKCR